MGADLRRQVCNIEVFAALALEGLNQGLLLGVNGGGRDRAVLRCQRLEVCPSGLMLLGELLRRLLDGAAYGLLQGQLRTLYLELVAVGGLLHEVDLAHTQAAQRLARLTALASCRPGGGIARANCTCTSGSHGVTCTRRSRTSSAPRSSRASGRCSRSATPCTTSTYAAHPCHRAAAGRCACRPGSDSTC